MVLKTYRSSPSDIYRSIIDEDIELFKKLIKNRSHTDLSNHSFRFDDLRKFDLNGKSVDFNGCYFKGTDLRGLDLSQCTFDGASFGGAHVSGVLFPTNVKPEELALSLDKGTRIRTL